MNTILIPYQVHPDSISFFQKQHGPFSSWTGDKKNISEEEKRLLSEKKIAYSLSKISTKSNTILLQRIKKPIIHAGYTKITLKTNPNLILQDIKKITLTALQKNTSSKKSSNLYKHFSKAVVKENKKRVKEIITKQKKIIQCFESKRYKEAEELSTSFSLKTFSQLTSSKESTKQKLTAIQECAQALKNNLRKEHAYTDQELLRLAVFIHGRLKKLGMQREHFKRGSFGIVRSLRYDASNKAVYILHKSKERTESGKDIKVKQASGISKIAKPVTKILLAGGYETFDAIELVPEKGKSAKEFTENITFNTSLIKKEHHLIEKFLKKHNLAHLDCFPKTFKVFKYYKRLPKAYQKSISVIQPRGIELYQALKKGMVFKENILPIAERLLFAIKSLHEKKQLHWDVKPENALLYDKKAVLTDFGMSFDGSKDIPPCTNQTYGTPIYTAPELNLVSSDKKMPFEFYEKAEAFAVGFTLYALLFGKHSQKDLPELLEKIERKKTSSKDPKKKELLQIVRDLLEPDRLSRISCIEAYKRLQQIA